MIGYYAKKVKFNYDGIQRRAYSGDMFKDWEGAIKLAISTDVFDEDIPDADIRLEEAHRYGLACEDVIIDLLFWCKWNYIPDWKCNDENKG